MPQESVIRPWGNETVNVTLPDQWRLQGVLEPSSLPACPDAPAEIQRALAEPIGAPRLTDVARAGLSVAIAIDDASRPTPVARILPQVLSQFEAAGVERSHMVLVPALGLHRPMTGSEIAQRGSRSKRYPHGHS